MNRDLRDQRGMALLLALGAISLLVAVTVHLAVSVQQGLGGAMIMADSVRLDARLWSLVDMGRTALYLDQQENDFDSRHDSWAGLNLEKMEALFDGEQSEMRIRDLSGLIQVNALVPPRPSGPPSGAGGWQSQTQEQMQRELWLRFLQQERIGLSQEEAVALVDALADWLDPDDEPRPDGAESSHYRSLEQPYEAKNGPVLSLEELLLVKGMNRKILYGDKEHSGIIDYLTEQGYDGTININTTPELILQVLHPEMNDTLAAMLVAFRQEKGNRELLASTDWYRQVDGFPEAVVISPALLTVQSRFFALNLAVAAPSRKQTATVVVERQKNREQNILAWKVD